MITHLRLWPLRLKLALAPPNQTGADGTHNGEVRRIRNRDGEVAKDLCDS